MTRATRLIFVKALPVAVVATLAVAACSSSHPKTSSTTTAAGSGTTVPTGGAAATTAPGATGTGATTTAGSGAGTTTSGSATTIAGATTVPGSATTAATGGSTTTTGDSSGTTVAGTPTTTIATSGGLNVDRATTEGKSGTIVWSMTLPVISGIPAAPTIDAAITKVRDDILAQALKDGVSELRVDAGATVAQPSAPLSFAFDVFSTTGTKGDLRATIGLTLDATTGAPIDLADILATNGNPFKGLSIQIRQGLDEVGIPLDDTGLKNTDPTPSNFSNWYLTPDSLVVVVAAGRVADVKMGPQEVEVLFTTPDLFNASGPLKPLMTKK